MASRKQAKNSSKNVSINNITDYVSTQIQQRFNQFINDIKSNFSKYGWKYKNNINLIVDGLEWVVEIPQYYNYLDYGVNGSNIRNKQGKNYGSKYSRGNKLPPLSAVEEWMREKGLDTKHKFAMQKTWHVNGLPPRDVYVYLIDDLMEDIKQIISSPTSYKNWITAEINKRLT